MLSAWEKERGKKQREFLSSFIFFQSHVHFFSISCSFFLSGSFSAPSFLSRPLGPSGLFSESSSSSSSGGIAALLLLLLPPLLPGPSAKEHHPLPALVAGAAAAAAAPPSPASAPARDQRGPLHSLGQSVRRHAPVRGSRRGPWVLGASLRGSLLRGRCRRAAPFKPAKTHQPHEARSRRRVSWLKVAPTLYDGNAPWPAPAYLEAWRAPAHSVAQARPP